MGRPAAVAAAVPPGSAARCRPRLRLRNLAQLFLDCGMVFNHETVRHLATQIAPPLTARLRAKRQGNAGTSWHWDETYIKVPGRWCYLYRAIDRDGNLVDSMLSERRCLWNMHV